MVEARNLQFRKKKLRGEVWHKGNFLNINFVYFSSNLDFLRDLWIRSQCAVLASKRANNLATYPPELTDHRSNLATPPTHLNFKIQFLADLESASVLSVTVHVYASTYNFTFQVQGQV